MVWAGVAIAGVTAVAQVANEVAKNKDAANTSPKQGGGGAGGNVEGAVVGGVSSVAGAYGSGPKDTPKQGTVNKKPVV